MRSILVTAGCVAAGLALAATGQPATARALETVEEIEQCVRDNLPAASSRQVVSFRAVDPFGEETVSRAEVFWRKFPAGNRALVRFSAPPNLRGSSLLLIEAGERADMFMYLPELRKVRRIQKRSLSGSMFGTDFTYEDFERLQGFADDPETKRLPDTEVEGRAAYLLEIRPAPDSDSQYQRIVVYVDQERCVPLRSELFDGDGELRKVLTAPAERTLRERSTWVPRLARLEDRKDRSYTELTVDEIEVDVELPQKLFSERELAKSGH